MTPTTTVTTIAATRYVSTGGLPWRTMRLFGSEISHLRAVLNARFPNSGGGPVIDLTTALDTAEWQKTVPVELTPDTQLAYRLASAKNPHWRIGPAQLPAYRNILTQLPTTIPTRAGVTPPSVLVRETVGALREHHTKHHTGTRHYDQLITAAITAANLDQVRMPLTLTDTTTELLHLLHDTAPNDAVLTDITRRLRPPHGSVGGR